MSWLKKAFGAKPKGLQPWPSDGPRIVEGRYWSVRDKNTEQLGNVMKLNLDRARMFREKRMAAYAEQVDISQFGDLGDVVSPPEIDLTSGKPIPRLPIDPANMDTELVVPAHVFTGEKGFKTGTVFDAAIHGLLVSERVHDVLAPLQGQQAQFFPILFKTEDGSSAEQFYRIRLLDAVRTIARIESGYRPFIEAYTRGSGEVRNILQWDKPGQGPDAPETFLDATALNGQAAVEARDLSPWLLLSDEVVQALDLENDPDLTLTPYRQVDPWPEPDRDEVLAARGVHRER